MSSTQARGYRPDIDGLRALAVLSVIAFHATPQLLPGGFVGVDIFFVISGYLITGILLEDLASDRFSLIDFYRRRIKRIFPALILVLVAVMAFGWRALLTDEYRLLGKHTAGGAVYISNILLHGEAGYFDVASEYKPLLHLWSLGIEEQFYILWPLLLFLAFKYRINIFQLTLILAMMSFASNLAEINEHETTAAFYLLQNRAWELLAGGCLAHFSFFQCKKPVIPAVLENNATLIPQLVSYIGVLLLASALVVLNKDYTYPGWYAMLPVTGTFFVIAAGPRAWFNQKILAKPIFVAIGLISYPLYLWHWPLLSLQWIIGRDREPSESKVAIIVTAIVLSFVLAWLTYALLERKIRPSKERWVPIQLFTLLLAIGVSGELVAEGTIRPYYSDPRIDKIVKAAGEWQYPEPNQDVHGLALRVKPAAAEKVAFLGDSNMAQYWPRIEKLIDENPTSAKTAVFVTAHGCPPIPQIQDHGHPYCQDFMEKALHYLSVPDIQAIVIGAQWFGYLEGSSYFIPGKGRLALNSPATEAAYENLTAMLKHFIASGKRVYLILNIPIGIELDPKHMVQRSWTGKIDVDTEPLSRDKFNARFEKISSELKKIATTTGAIYIDPTDSLCDRHACSIVMADGEPIYKDGVHLRPSYVRDYVTFLDGTVLSDGFNKLTTK